MDFLLSLKVLSQIKIIYLKIMSTSCAKHCSRLCKCSMSRKGKVACVTEFTLLIDQKSKYQNKLSKAQLGLYPLYNII